jgi:hypothetical protein
MDSFVHCGKVEYKGEMKNDVLLNTSPNTRLWELMPNPKK